MAVGAEPNQFVYIATSPSPIIALHKRCECQRKISSTYMCVMMIQIRKYILLVVGCLMGPVFFSCFYLCSWSCICVDWTSFNFVCWWRPLFCTVKNVQDAIAIVKKEIKSMVDWLTHWGRVTHICVGKLTIISSYNGLSPGRRQAIIWTSAGIVLIGPLGTNFSEILIEINTFSLKKMHLKMSSGKWRPFVWASIR